MTVAELRALLETLPPRFDDTEVMVYSGRGLCHVTRLDLDRRKSTQYEWVDVPEDRLERKLRIVAGTGLSPRVLWYEPAPEWRLGGWWPKEAGDIGLVDCPEVVG